MKEETTEWLAKAEEDFKTAEFNLKGKKLPAAAFYSQQSAEKALKALQIELLGNFKKTHDLVILGESVNAPEDILNTCKELTPFYIITRYPDSKEIYGKHEVTEAINYAKEVFEWVKSQLISSKM